MYGKIYSDTAWNYTSQVNQPVKSYAEKTVNTKIMEVHKIKYYKIIANNHIQTST